MSQETLTNQTIEQHSILKSTFLHLFPGLLSLTFYCLTAPIAVAYGFPSMFAFILSMICTSLPFELGYLLYQGEKINGEMSLKKLFNFKSKLSLDEYLLLIPALVIWGAVCLGFIGLVIDPIIINKVFSFLPEWFNVNDIIYNAPKYSTTTLIVTILLCFIVLGIIAPLIEELYFRGYLLPRISEYESASPIINATLFCIYHFHAPWQLFSNLLFYWPFAHLVWKRNDLRLALYIRVILGIGLALSLIPLIWVE